MKKFGVVGLTTLLVLGLASVAMASSDPAMIATISIAAAIAVGVVGLGSAIGIGLIGYSACAGIARNPETSGKITTTMILAIAFAESLTIFGLVISLILLFAHPLL